MEDLQRKRMMRSVTFWRSLVLPLSSLLASGVIVAATIRHLPFSDPSPALLSGLIATALLTRVLLIVLPRMAQELQACDPSLRQLIIGLIAGGAIIAFFSVSMPRPLAWQWGAGPQAGAPAPLLYGSSWDKVNRAFIHLHATYDPSATPYGVWRAAAALDEAAGVQPAQAELWLTQPSWAVIDATTGRPPPNIDGVDVAISVQRGQELLLERRIALDPPATAEQGRWRRVTLNLPPGAERLIVEVHPRGLLDHDFVWVTEAVVSPVWSVVIVDWAAWVLLIALGASTLAFAGRLQPVVRAARSISRFFAVYGWLVVGLACLWLAYLLVWQRGFYFDDWSAGLTARDWQTLEWLPIEFTPERMPNFPARILTHGVVQYLIALLWTDEFLVRSLMAGCVGLNAFLLGWLVYRMLRSRLPAIVAGWLFLTPVYTDVALWAGAAGYVFLTGTTLVMLHVIWSALVVDNPKHIWLLIGVLMLIALMWGEATIGVVGIIPLMGILYRVQQPEVKWRTVVHRVTLGVIVPTIVIVLYGFLVIGRSPLATQRGEVTLDMTLIAERAYGWLRALYWFTLDPTWGRHFVVSSYMIGLDHVLSLRFGIILLLSSSVVLGWTVVSWRSDDQFNKVSEILLVLALGVVWFLATLYLPYVFVSEQVFETRFLYFPLAGASIAAGALAALTASVIRRRRLQQMLLAGCGVLLIILSVCMVGYGRMYKARYERDMNMFLALERFAPSEALPERPQFIPVNLDYGLPGKENLLTGLIISAFEAPWSARSGISMIYPGKDFEYIASSRWFPAKFSEHVPDVPYYCKTRNATINVFVQRCPLDPERAIVFSSRNGELALVRTLTLQRSDGTTRIIELPVVSRLAARGATIIETLAVPVEG